MVADIAVSRLKMPRSNKNNAAKDILEDQFIRAEDIILGSLGFGEDAAIVSIVRNEGGFAGEGRFSDGDSFEFNSNEDPDTLERWALAVLEARLPKAKRKIIV